MTLHWTVSIKFDLTNACNQILATKDECRMDLVIAHHCACSLGWCRCFTLFEYVKNWNERGRPWLWRKTIFFTKNTWAFVRTYMYAGNSCHNTQFSLSFLLKKPKLYSGDISSCCVVLCGHLFFLANFYLTHNIYKPWDDVQNQNWLKFFKFINCCLQSIVSFSFALKTKDVSNRAHVFKDRSLCTALT